jgi:alkanesulfonate monooxygenase SsuD/methylene tetrahydromethanopterin reductase-like flavin-dependent oxidoreductase (luciferase family)
MTGRCGSLGWWGRPNQQAPSRRAAKAQWAEDHGFVWFSVMDHLIQISGVGAPDEPFMEGWTVLSALAAVTSRAGSLVLRMTIT